MGTPMRVAAIAALQMHFAPIVFHGHAHLGAPRAQTLGGIPVFNVAEPVLRRHGLDLRIWSVRDAVNSGITDAEVR